MGGALHMVWWVGWVVPHCQRIVLGLLHGCVGGCYVMFMGGWVGSEGHDPP